MDAEFKIPLSEHMVQRLPVNTQIHIPHMHRRWSEEQRKLLINVKQVKEEVKQSTGDWPQIICQFKLLIGTEREIKLAISILSI